MHKRASALPRQRKRSDCCGAAVSEFPQQRLPPPVFSPPSVAPSPRLPPSPGKCLRRRGTKGEVHQIIPLGEAKHILKTHGIRDATMKFFIVYKSNKNLFF